MGLLLASRNLLANLFSPLKKLFFCKNVEADDDVETFCHQAYSWEAMKTSRLLAAGLLFYGGIIAIAAADTPASGYEPGTDPRAEGESAPPPFTRQPTARVKETAPQNNDWLLRGYEEQLQARALAGGQSQDNNLYVKLSSDKALAQASGLSSPAPATPAGDTLRTGAVTGAAPLSLRTDATLLPAGAPAPSQSSLAASTGIQLKPLITPLGSSEVAGLHDLFARLPELSNQALAVPAPAESDPGALDVPGMVAAESDPTKRANLDLALDPLPGETESQAAANHHEFALNLPVASDAERIHTEQDTALLPPGKRKTVGPLPINPKLMKPVSDTAEMVPEGSPIRGQVADPYDMLR
jgi:hypothetical protein